MESPPPAETLCHLDDIPDGQAKGFALDRGGATLRLFVARRGARVYGYSNACPHVGVPLDWTEDRFMTLDGMHLLCGTHGAQFRVEDGFCVLGPCKGKSLRGLPIRLAPDGRVVLDPA